MVVVAIASYLSYFALEFCAHRVHFPSLFVPQSLLSPCIPLAPIIQNWLDVDSRGLYGIAARAGMFAVLATGLLFLILKSRETRHLVYRVPMYLVSGWYVLTFIGFHVFFMMMYHSGWTD